MKENKFFRIIAIIALALMGIFTVALILYLFDKTLLNGAIGALAAWSGGIGFLLCVFLWLSRAFPAQKAKDNARAKLQQEYDELTAKEQAAKDAESDDNEQGHNDGAKGESASGGQDVDKQ